jgi:hypothetical protein
LAALSGHGSERDVGGVEQLVEAAQPAGDLMPEVAR